MRVQILETRMQLPVLHLREPLGSTHLFSRISFRPRVRHAQRQGDADWRVEDILRLWVLSDFLEHAPRELTIASDELWSTFGQAKHRLRRCHDEEVEEEDCWYYERHAQYTRCNIDTTNVEQRPIDNEDNIVTSASVLLTTFPDTAKQLIKGVWIFMLDIFLDRQTELNKRYI